MMTEGWPWPGCPSFCCEFSYETSEAPVDSVAFCVVATVIYADELELCVGYLSNSDFAADLLSSSSTKYLRCLMINFYAALGFAWILV